MKLLLFAIAVVLSFDESVQAPIDGGEELAIIIASTLVSGRRLAISIAQWLLWRLYVFKHLIKSTHPVRNRSTNNYCGVNGFMPCGILEGTVVKVETYKYSQGQNLEGGPSLGLHGPRV